MIVSRDDRVEAVEIDHDLFFECQFYAHNVWNILYRLTRTRYSGEMTVCSYNRRWWCFKMRILPIQPSLVLSKICRLYILAMSELSHTDLVFSLEVRPCTLQPQWPEEAFCVGTTHGVSPQSTNQSNHDSRLRLPHTTITTYGIDYLSTPLHQYQPWKAGCM